MVTVDAPGLRDDALRLDEWIARHGPLWPAAALTLTVEACAAASRLDDRTLRNVIGSLTPAGVVRQPEGWVWRPVPHEAEARDLDDVEIVERLGAILFCALSGQTHVDLFASEAAWRQALRQSRPELPPLVVEVTLSALSARQHHGTTLVMFAREVRQLLGVERPAPSRLRRVGVGAGVIAAAMLCSGAAWWSYSAVDRIGTNGLTPWESVRQDIVYEFATTDAMVDEHTAALGLYAQWGRMWRARLAPDDARLTWALVHQAWVRTLAADRLTARQLLDDAPATLSRELGSPHPYTRAARLALADTLAAQGETLVAARLREDAARAAAELLSGFQAAELLDTVPAPPGVIAHVSPNRPEEEGFRSLPGARFMAPLTSLQRLIAGRDGWRLHVVANGSCEASVAFGNVPRRVGLTTSRHQDGHWLVSVSETTPAVQLAGPAEPTVGLSIIADGAGTLHAQVGERRMSILVDTASALPEPPYALTFSASEAGKPSTGCSVVWLEIPFPYYPGAKVTGPPASR